MLPPAALSPNAAPACYLGGFVGGPLTTGGAAAPRPSDANCGAEKFFLLRACLPGTGSL